MTIVVKLGGTNGSGKTSVARALLDKMVNKSSGTFNSIEIEKHGGLTTGNIECKRWAILGSYRTTCGGMDTISDKFLRLDMVRGMAEAKHKTDNVDIVFFEGLITGKTYGAFGAMSEEPQHKGKWIYAFMDTPYDTCVARVQQRRLRAALDKGKLAAPFNPERTLLPTYKSVLATAKRAAQQGHAVLWLPHALAPQAIAEHLLNYVAMFGTQWEEGSFK